MSESPKSSEKKSKAEPLGNPAAREHRVDEHFQKHVRLALGVFGALVVFTFLTVGASYIDMGHEGNISLALIIATLKAAMVAAVFMHLLGEKRMVFRVLIFTLIFFAGLFILTLGTYHDAVESIRVP